MKNFQKKIKLYLFIIASVCLSGSCVAQKYSKFQKKIKELNEQGLYQEIITEVDKSWGNYVKEEDNKIEMLMTYGDAYSQLGNDEKADSLLALASLLCENSKDGVKHYNYITCLTDRGLVKMYLEQYTEALNLLETALKYAEKDNEKYAQILISKGSIFLKQKKIDLAYSLFCEANVLAEKHKFKSINFIQAVGKMGDCEQSKGEYIKAEKSFQKYLELALKSKNKGMIANAYGNLGAYFNDMGNVLEAQKYGKKSLLLEKGIQGNEKNFLIQLYNITLTYSIEDLNVDSSFHYLDLYKEFIKEYNGKDKTIWELRQNELEGNINYLVGNFELSDFNYQKSIDFIEKDTSLLKIDVYNTIYIFTLSNQSTVYLYAKKYDKALQVNLKAYNNYMKNDDNPNIKATLLGNLGSMFANLEMYDKSKRCTLKNLDILEKMNGKESISYQKKLSDLGTDLFREKDFSNAITQFKKSYQATLKELGNSSAKLGIVSSNMMVCYAMMNELDSVVVYHSKCVGIIKKTYIQNLLILSENNRKTFANKFKDTDNTINRTAYHNPSNPTLQQNTYNYALLTKGVVLDATKNWKSSLENTKDISLKTLYDNWLEKKIFLSQQYKLEISKRVTGIDSLERYTQNLEGELCRKSSSFREVNQQVTWEQVQAKLKDGEAAIEFIDFTYRGKYAFKDSDSTMYAALLVRKGDVAPIMIGLYDEKTIKSIIGNTIADGANYLSREALLIQLWQPLEPYLQGIKKIYYSPSGLLNRVSFGAIAYDAGKYLSDKYEFRLLRSTRELVVSNLDDVPKTTNSTHFIIGNIDFGNNTNQLAKTKDGGICGLLNFENGEKEFSNFTKLANDANVNILAKQKKEATETYVKSKLVSPSPEVLIFSTHGYYEEKPRENATNPLQSIKEPLLRTGIMLTDANLAWCGNPIAAGKEDGLLTAYEISNMDLSNTQVVVLSACQSGVGDLQGSEGVYGLQRAFKMAGVKNVLCTLWKVDAVTAEQFVSIFYAEILNGRTAHEAFVVAQNNLRNAIDKDNSLKYSPNLWGAFVLVE